MCFEETTEPFMEQLQEVINNIPNNDINILFITGDFNAKLRSLLETTMDMKVHCENME